MKETTEPQFKRELFLGLIFSKFQVKITGIGFRSGQTRQHKRTL